MEFNKKLQELRKNKELTQEELAASLYVSRAAISKWESGRGYPNLDSLKAIAKFFSITIDELLSGEEVVAIAKEENQQTKSRIFGLILGLLDCSIALLFVLPIFGERSDNGVSALPLFSLTIPPYLKAAYFAAVVGMILWGVLAVALQYSRPNQWEQGKRSISIALNLVAIILFIISPQPYAAMLLIVILGIKIMILIKRR